MKKVLLLFLGLTLTSLTQAQFNKLLKNSTKEKPAKVAELVYDNPLKPSIDYYNFLNVLLHNFNSTPTGAYIKMEDRLKVYFLPSKDVNGKAVDYNADVERLHVLLYYEDQPIYDVYCGGTPINDIAYEFIFTTYNLGDNRQSKVLNPALMTPVSSNNQFITAINLQEGKYKFQFLLDSKLITEVPFLITKLVNPDAYATTKNKYFIQGPWAEYGFLQFEGERNEEDPNMSFTSFYQFEDFTLTRKNYIGYYQLFKDGKMIANTYGEYPAEDERNSVVADEVWNEERDAFRLLDSKGKPVNGDHAYFKKSDLKDGAYEVRTTVNKKVRKFNFSVKDSKIVLAGRQLRDTPKPEYFVEGGGKLYWIQQEGGNYLK